MKQLFTRILEPKQQLKDSQKRFSNHDLFQLILPIIIEQFLAMLVGMADTLMVSYAGEAAVSGVSLVNQLNNIFIMIFTALASGGAIVASQYVGSGQHREGILASGQLVMLVTLVSFVSEAVLLIWGSPIFHLLFGKVDQPVYEAGMTYLIISAWSFPFLALYNGCAGLYRSMGLTKTLMNVSVVMNIINVIGNSIGIFVLHAGVAGVAYPSLISRAFAAVVMLYLMGKKNHTLYITFRSVFAWNREMISRIVHVALPNGIENGLFQFSKVALSSIVALFGTVQIAANGVAQSFWSMAALFCVAMGPAFITVIGQCMGAGDMEAADYYMKKLLRMTWLGSVIWDAAFLALTPAILLLYDLSGEAVHLVIILVIIHNVFNAAVCPVTFGLSTGLRAAGDVNFTMWASIFATVVCRVFFSVVFGLWFHMGVIGIALAMACDWMIKAGLIWYRYRSNRWKNFSVI